MDILSKFSFRVRIALLGILSILLLLTIVLPPLITQYSEPTIERINVSEYDEELVLYLDGIYSLVVYYNDTWHNVPVSNATLSASSGDSDIVEIISLDTDSESAGIYLVTILAKFPGETSLTINLTKPTYASQSVTLIAHVHPSYPPPPPPQSYGLLGLAIILIISIYYEKRTQKNLRKNGAPGEI